MNNLGKWIKQMRTDRHMNQEELIDALATLYKVVTKSTLSAWENQKINTPVHEKEFVDALATIFGVPVIEVFRGAGYSVGEAYPELDEDRRKLLNAYDRGDLDALMRIALDKRR